MKTRRHEARLCLLVGAPSGGTSEGTSQNTRTQRDAAHLAQERPCSSPASLPDQPRTVPSWRRVRASRAGHRSRPESIDGVHEIIAENRLAPAAVLLTHGHMDHIWSVAPLAREFEIPALIHADDRYRLADPAGSSMAAAREQLLATTKNSLELTEPDDVQLLHRRDADIELGAFVLPSDMPWAHEGSAVFQAERGDDVDVLFSGDVLFQGSIGRTDLPGGVPTR